VRILALNPYGGGSHATVLDGWRRYSRHHITVLDLPGRHWKWRMRHSAWTLAEQAAALDDRFDLVWTTDMLDLAAWRGLAPAHLTALPSVCYFHENQLLYPDNRAGERDLHFAFTNLLGAAAADAVWFNSSWHRQALLDAWRTWIKRLPDYAPLSAVDRVADRSRVVSPGLDPLPTTATTNTTCHLLWCARWEDDKGPARFTAAVENVLAQGHDLRLSFLGGHSADSDHPFARLRQHHPTRIAHWGYLTERSAYHDALAAADIVVSCAEHEFFGLAMLEACLAGCVPLAPNRLAYPETLAPFGPAALYADDELSTRLSALVEAHRDGTLHCPEHNAARTQLRAHCWPQRVSDWDRAAEETL
jgi:glycosyltransferase involved in cell wall biosynthesis